MSLENKTLSELKRLLNNEFLEDVKSVGGFVLALDENTHLFSLPAQIQLYSLLGDAFYGTHEHRKAETMFNRSFHLRKMQQRQTTTNSNASSMSEVSINTSQQTPSHGHGRKKGSKDTIGTPVVVEEVHQPQTHNIEVELRWKSYMCHMALRSYKEGLAVLESIPIKQRTARVHMALGSLYLRYGQERAAQQEYREVLHECPWSLEAARSLLQSGAQLSDLEYTESAFQGFEHCDLMKQWFSAHQHSFAREYAHAADALSGLDGHSCGWLRDSPALLCELAECHYQAGDARLAETVFRRVHSLDPQWLRHMDSFAELLHRNSSCHKELEKLALALLQVTEYRSEPWIAFGYLCFATKKIPRSLYFAQKAFMLDSTCLHSLLLKGNGLLKHKKDKEALMHFNEARRLAPYSFQVMKGLVECYLAREKVREATMKANETIKLLGSTSRTLTLYANVLMKSATQLDKARSLLEKALKMESGNLEAVYLLAELYMAMMKHKEGCTLLRKTLQEHNTSELHQMLGDFLSRTADYREALEHYNLSVSLDPNNKKAQDGIYKTERQEEANQSDYYGYGDPDTVRDTEWSD